MRCVGCGEEEQAERRGDNGDHIGEVRASCTYILVEATRSWEVHALIYNPVPLVSKTPGNMHEVKAITPEYLPSSLPMIPYHEWVSDAFPMCKTSWYHKAQRCAPLP
jgi:hypothetical protein